MEWDQAQLCLKACGKLGSLTAAILSTAQLRGSQTRWMHLEELRSRHCHLTKSEYTTLTSWLPASREDRMEETADRLGGSPATGKALITGCDGEAARGKPSAGRCPERMPLPTAQACAVANVSAHLAPCIGGQITDTLQHNQLVLHQIAFLKWISRASRIHCCWIISAMAGLSFPPPATTRMPSG